MHDILSGDEEKRQLNKRMDAINKLLQQISPSKHTSAGAGTATSSSQPPSSSSPSASVNEHAEAESSTVSSSTSTHTSVNAESSASGNVGSTVSIGSNDEQASSSTADYINNASSTPNTRTSNTPSRTSNVQADPVCDDDDMSRASCGNFVYGEDDGTLGQRWEQWLERFMWHIEANNIEAPRRKSSLLLMLDQDAYNVYKTLTVAANASATFDEVCTALNVKFVCKRNELVEETKFMGAKRHEGESINDYVTRLRRLATYCGFDDIDKRITSQLIYGANLPELTLDCSKTDKRMELSAAVALASGYERQIANMRALQGAAAGSTVHYASGGKPKQASGGSGKCHWCAKEQHERSQCPAKDATCGGCGKLGHFKAACMSRGRGSDNSANARSESNNRSFSKSDGSSSSSQQGRKSSFRSNGKSQDKTLKWNSTVKCVEQEQSESTTINEDDMEEFLRWKRSKSLGIDCMPVAAVTPRAASGRFARVSIGGAHVRHLVDTGAPVNIIDELSYEALACKPTLQQCNTPFFGLRSTEPLPVIGQFTCDVEFDGKIARAGYIVVKGKCICLLSCKTSEDLDILTFNKKLVYQVTASDSEQPPTTVARSAQELHTTQQWKERFPALFTEGMGCIRGVEVKLNVDEQVQPVRQKLRTVAVHLRDAVERELQVQLEAGIIERVKGPTPYISNLVVVPKGPKLTGSKLSKQAVGADLQVRLTCDCKPLNKAIKRTRHPTRTLEDIVHLVEGAKVFCKLDITKAFHQVMLAEESRNFTTITTHVGLFRYRRLHMGISCASEEFSEIIRKLLEDCDGQLNMTDDVLVFGSSTEQLRERLFGVCQTLENAGVTLNMSKCELFKDELTFFGLKFSKDGIAPTEDRCRALRNAAAPTNASELRSLLGSAMWSGRFIKKISTIIDALWPLTNKNALWHWGDVEQKALDDLKAALTGEALAYFNKEWLTEVHTDASPVGLSSILIQVDPNNSDNKRVICYASRRLTDVERRYSQCEKEGLAAVWGCERYWVYLFGAHFKLVTDNRAIQMIFSNAARRPPARIERLALRLSQFDYTIEHQPGESNVADYFSRHPDPATDLSKLEEEQLNEHYVNVIVESSMPAAITITEMASETLSDDELQQLVKYMRSDGRAPLPDALKQYSSVVSELSEASNGVILRGRQILVPRSLRARVAELAHRGHQGIVKTKALVRSRVWFPGIDAAIESRVLACQACQVNTKKQQYEPMIPSAMPGGPWRVVHADFFGPMGDGSYWFVNRCAYSRYTFVHTIKSTSFESVKKVLDEIITFVGRPEEYVTDNGAPFQSHFFAEYVRHNGFKHRRVTPLWPQANGEAERFMASLGKVLRNAKAASIDKHVALREFMRAYHETPHSSTKVAPAMLMFGFSNSSGIPSLEANLDLNELHRAAKENDKVAKATSKTNYDKRMGAREHALVVGMKVWVKRKPTDKSMSPWDPEPYEIVSIKGRRVTATRCGNNNHSIIRNSSHFKPFLGSALETSTDDRATFATDETPEVPVIDGDQVARDNHEDSVDGSEHAADEGALEHDIGGVAVDDGISVSPTQAAAPAKKPSGRPSKAKSEQNKLDRQLKLAEDRRLNPPTRSSERIRDQASASLQK